MFYPVRYFFVQTRFALEDFVLKFKDFVESIKLRKIDLKANSLSNITQLLHFKPDYLEIKDHKLKAYMVSQFPQIIYPDWLYELGNYSEPLIISQFIKPLDSKKALKGLRNRITNLASQFEESAKQGRLHTTDLEQAINDARNIEQDIVRGTEKLYSTSMYIQLSDFDEESLQKRSKRLEELLYAKQLKSYLLKYRQKDGLQAFLPTASNSVNEELYVTSSNISSSLLFTNATLSDENGIFYGIASNGTKIKFDRFSKSSKNYNGIIFATSGAGKSFAAKMEIYRSLFKGIKIFVIDPEGEFGKLCRAVGGTHIEINPESKLKINPLQFFSDKASKESMRQHLGVVKGLLKIWLSNEAYNKGLVSQVVSQTYKDKGILLEDPETYSNEPPLISDLVNNFKALGSEGKAISAELLEYTKEGELGDLYDNPTSESIDLNSSLTVFNIQKVPEQEKLASIYFLSNFIWQKVLADREPKILVIDEAHLLLKEESSALFMENLVRRGRKYNLGTICISQDVDDFLNSPQGSVIAKNAETALLLSQKLQSIPSISKAFELSKNEQEYLTRLTKGQALFIKGNIRSYSYMYATEHEQKLFSSNPEDLISNEK